MNLHKLVGVFLLLFLMADANTTHAISLGEYGITLTSNGFVDTTTDLAWLSADLTFGTSDVVDGYIEQGWRIATRNELAHLLDRSAETWFDVGNSSVLYYDQFELMLTVLGIPPNTEFQSSWMCRGYQCDNVDGPYFEQPAIFSEPDYNNGDILGPITSFLAISYISEAYLYGTYDTVCETCTGRTMLVKAVPLPASIWGFVAAVGALWQLRKKGT